MPVERTTPPFAQSKGEQVRRHRKALTPPPGEAVAASRSNDGATPPQLGLRWAGRQDSGHLPPATHRRSPKRRRRRTSCSCTVPVGRRPRFRRESRVGYVNRSKTRQSRSPQPDRERRPSWPSPPRSGQPWAPMSGTNDTASSCCHDEATFRRQLGEEGRWYARAARRHDDDVVRRMFRPAKRTVAASARGHSGTQDRSGGARRCRRARQCARRCRPP